MSRESRIESLHWVPCDLRNIELEDLAGEVCFIRNCFCGRLVFFRFVINSIMFTTFNGNSLDVQQCLADVYY